MCVGPAPYSVLDCADPVRLFAPSMLYRKHPDELLVGIALAFHLPEQLGLHTVDKTHTIFAFLAARRHQAHVFHHGVAVLAVV